MNFRLHADLMLPNNIVDFILQLKDDDNEHTCLRCDYKSSDYYQMLSHVLRYKVWVCRFCCKSFKEIMFFKYHMQEHTGEFGFYCSECKKSTLHKGLLQHIAEDHTEEAKVVPCTYEICRHILYGYMCHDCGVVKLTKALAEDHQSKTESCSKMSRINLSKFIIRKSCNAQIHSLMLKFEARRMQKKKERVEIRLLEELEVQEEAVCSVQMNFMTVDEKVQETINSTFEVEAREDPKADTVEYDDNNEAVDELNKSNSNGLDENIDATFADLLVNLDSLRKEVRINRKKYHSKRRRSRKSRCHKRIYMESAESSVDDTNDGSTSLEESSDLDDDGSNTYPDPVPRPSAIPTFAESTKEDLLGQMENTDLPVSSGTSENELPLFSVINIKTEMVDDDSNSKNEKDLLVESDQSPQLQVLENAPTLSIGQLNRIIKCPMCKERLPHTESSLTLHLFDHYNISSYACGLCNKQFMSQACFNVHAHEEHRRASVPCRLNRCPDYINDMVRHAFSEENQASVYSSPPKLIPCSPSKVIEGHSRQSSCNDLPSEETDALSLGSNNAYKCIICNNEYHSKVSISFHLRREHFPMYRCDLCNISFGFKADVNKHASMMHDGNVKMVVNPDYDAMKCRETFDKIFKTDNHSVNELEHAKQTDAEKIDRRLGMQLQMVEKLDQDGVSGKLSVERKKRKRPVPASNSKNKNASCSLMPLSELKRKLMLDCSVLVCKLDKELAVDFMCDT